MVIKIRHSFIDSRGEIFIHGSDEQAPVGPTVHFPLGLLGSWYVVIASSTSGVSWAYIVRPGFYLLVRESFEWSLVVWLRSVRPY